jgi:hypothetical protein
VAIGCRKWEGISILTSQDEEQIRLTAAEVLSTFSHSEKTAGKAFLAGRFFAITLRSDWTGLCVSGAERRVGLRMVERKSTSWAPMKVGTEVTRPPREARMEGRRISRKETANGREES